ncbi:hypothetical protein HanIR_Chr12g0595971 [Helianthus annuus]|nr:hypothetical protein HanIR_Chr12g0595971 [Helianthus annuus]
MPKKRLHIAVWRLELFPSTMMMIPLDDDELFKEEWISAAFLHTPFGSPKKERAKRTRV